MYLSTRSFHFQFQPSENETIIIRVLMEAEERMLNLPSHDFVIEDNGETGKITYSVNYYRANIYRYILAMVKGCAWYYVEIYYYYYTGERCEN